MNESSQWCVVTFHTTAAAMATERHCKAAQLEGRLVPVPRSLSSDCGIAWKAPAACLPRLQALLQEKQVETDGFHLL